MKKLILGMSAMFLIITFSGCSTFQVGEKVNDMKIGEGASVAHINYKCDGFYLFMIPLISGSPSSPKSLMPAFFTDSCAVSSVVDVITREGKSMGGKSVENMTSSYSKLGFIFYMVSTQISGNVTK